MTSVEALDLDNKKEKLTHFPINNYQSCLNHLFDSNIPVNK